MFHHILILDRETDAVRVIVNDRIARLTLSLENPNEIRQYMNGYVPPSDLDAKMTELRRKGATQFYVNGC